MTRDQLAAVVWQHASLLSSVDPQDRADAMTAILDAADEYAGTTTVNERRLAHGLAPIGLISADVPTALIVPGVMEQFADPVTGCLP